MYVIKQTRRESYLLFGNTMTKSIFRNTYSLIGYMPEVGDISLIDFNSDEECTEAFFKVKKYLSEYPVNLAGIEQTLGIEVSLDGIEYLKYKNLCTLVDL